MVGKTVDYQRVRNQRAGDALEENANLQEFVDSFLNPIADCDAIAQRFRTYADHCGVRTNDF